MDCNYNLVNSHNNNLEHMESNKTDLMDMVNVKAH